MIEMVIAQLDGDFIEISTSHASPVSILFNTVFLTAFIFNGRGPFRYSGRIRFNIKQTIQVVNWARLLVEVVFHHLQLLLCVVILVYIFLFQIKIVGENKAE